MVKLTVTYKAPEGDSKVVEVYGHTLYDGKPEEIEVSEEIAEKIRKHPLYQSSGHKPNKAEPKQPEHK